MTNRYFYKMNEFSLKLILSFFIITASNAIFSQDFISKHQEEIIDLYKEYVDSNVIDTSKYKVENWYNELVITKKGEDKIVTSYCFNNYNYSGFIEIDYYNANHHKKHLKNLENSRKNKWVQVKKGYYLTKNKLSIIDDEKNGIIYTCGYLKVVPSGVNEIPLKILCGTTDLQRNKWKTLIKNK